MGEKYNGWSNYETWCCKLWIDNDEEAYNYWQTRVKELEEANTDKIAYSLSKEIEEEVASLCPELTGMYQDLLNTALGHINFYEIAQCIVDDYLSKD